jgi:hypothetical protein
VKAEVRVWKKSAEVLAVTMKAEAQVGKMRVEVEARTLRPSFEGELLWPVQWWWSPKHNRIK